MAVLRSVSRSCGDSPRTVQSRRCCSDVTTNGWRRWSTSSKSTGRATGEFDRLDADEVETHAAAIACAFDRLEQVDLVILSVGVLGGQSGLDADPNEVAQVLRTNFLGCGSLLWHTVRALRKQGHGTVVVLSSVAAERARASNAIYGAAKAGLDALAQGLADAVAGTSVRVLVIRPGFVGTRMTAGLKPGPLSGRSHKYDNVLCVRSGA